MAAEASGRSGARPARFNRCWQQDWRPKLASSMMPTLFDGSPRPRPPTADSQDAVARKLEASHIGRGSPAARASQQPARGFATDACNLCGACGVALQLCVPCRSVAYCSREHQKLDWKVRGGGTKSAYPLLRFLSL